MASSDNEVPAPIIVKKIKKGGGGHHGGAWKVAYADFVTAMMAFFLLMWLLNVTTKEEKNAISNYFDPTHPRVSNDNSGAGGILGGLSMSPDGAQVSTVQDIAVPSTPTTPQMNQAKGEQEDLLDASEFEGGEFETDKASKDDEDGNDLKDGLNVFDEIQNIDDAELEKLQAFIEEQQNESFEDIKQKIMEEVQKTPELADLMDHLMIDITPEGLRIQIIDKDGRSMFPVGSADMFDFMRKLVAKVTQVIIPQPNKISVRGHTDGKPYPDGAAYNNWNLSSDRALASRSAMIDAGLPADRIANVIGKADREHLLPDDPMSERNRRISIVLLRKELENAEEIRKAAAEAVQKRNERIEAKKKESGELQEDRENIPDLDRTMNGTSSAAPTLDNGNDGRSVPRGNITQPPSAMNGTNTTAAPSPSATSDDEGKDVNIGDEIKKIRDRNAAKSQEVQNSGPRPLPSPNAEDDDTSSPEPQILTFP